MNKKVYGIGTNNYQGKATSLRSYFIWRNMLSRCYNYKDKYYNIYGEKGVVVDDSWLEFDLFRIWYEDNYPSVLQEKFDIKFELDKDLLSEGKNIYSPTTCIFLPQKINSFMTNKKSDNVSGYIGVDWNKKTQKWRVRINDFDTGKRIFLGYFNNIEEANVAYETARKLQVEKAKIYLIKLGYPMDIINKLR